MTYDNGTPYQSVSNAGRSPAARQITVLPDQVNNLFHHDILVVILEKRHSAKKAFDLGVDAYLETRTGKVVHHRLDLTWRHVTGKPENAAEDKGEVYNVAHHYADILIAKKNGLKPTM